MMICIRIFYNVMVSPFGRHGKIVIRLVTRLLRELTVKRMKKSIADTFCSYFESVYSGSDTPEHNHMKADFNLSFSRYYSEHIDDDISPYLLSWADMIIIAKKIKLGKANAGSIKPEHFIHGCPSLLRPFQCLFNAMIQHS